MITLTRFDLIAKFIGHTPSKVWKILEDAYKAGESVQIEGPLYLSKTDIFGHEALETIHQFKKDHPNFKVSFV